MTAELQGSRSGAGSPAPELTSGKQSFFDGLKILVTPSSRRDMRSGLERESSQSRQNKTPAAKATGVGIRCLAVSYSHMGKPHTTIGAEHFHFRVRKGIGWFLLAIAARRNCFLGTVYSIATSKRLANRPSIAIE